jgi:hypothetical protein
MSGGLPEAFADVSDLAAALIKLDKEMTALGAPDRLRAQHALGLVLRFLQSALPQHVPDSLVKLLGALVSLDVGIVLPLLQPEPRAQRDPSGYVSVKAAAAATVQLLMNTGVPLEDAARKVAALLRNKIPLGYHRTIEDWQTVRAWRYAAQQDAGLLGEVYKGWLREALASPHTAESMLAEALVYNDK